MNDFSIPRKKFNKASYLSFEFLQRGSQNGVDSRTRPHSDLLCSHIEFAMERALNRLFAKTAYCRICTMMFKQHFRSIRVFP